MTVEEISAGLFRATGKNGLAAAIALDADDCAARVARGERNPLLGWKSLLRREVEATYAIEARCAPASRKSIAWEVTFLP